MFVTMIKKTAVLCLALALTLVAVIGAAAQAHSSSSSSACVSASSPALATTYLFSGTPSGAPLSDPVGPFPLSALVPFPWGSIDGIWSMKLPDGTKLHFSFEVASTCDGQKIVHVLGFEQKSYRVTSEGVAVSFSDLRVSGKDTTVRAVMSSSTSQYMVFLRQFRIPAGKATGRVSTVVTIRPFNGSEADDVHMVARRSSPLTLSEYVEKQRQNEAKRQAEIRKKLSQPKR